MFANKSSRSRDATLTLVAVAVVQFAVSLDLSVMNVGIPRIADALGFTDTSVTWVIHAYALAFGGLLLLGGKTADIFGQRRMLMVGLGLFGMASLAGGLATAPWHLVAARGLQGVGAAAAAPAALSLLTTTFPSGRARSKAFGVWAAVNASGGVLGVLVGGLLTEFAGWRWVMLVNVPMVAVAWVLVRLVPVRAVTVRDRARPDISGAVLATAGASVLVFAIVRTESVGWASWSTALTIVVASALIASFILVERRTRRDPLVRLGLFANRSLSGANAYNLMLGAAMAASFYLLSLYLQRVVGYGPAAAGASFVPFAVGVVVGSALSASLRRHVSSRALLMGGAVLAALGFVWFAALDSAGTFMDVMWPSLPTSIGFGLALAPVAQTATEGVDEREAGTASGLLNCSRQIGASLGLAAIGVVAAPSAAARTPLDIADGYATGFGACAVVLAGCVVVAALILPRHRSSPTQSTVTSDVGESASSAAPETASASSAPASSKEN